MTMILSQKEKILQALETVLLSIRKGNIEPTTGHEYQFDITYTNRQYSVFEIDKIEEHPKPWVIINNNTEQFNHLTGKKFQNRMYLDIIAFISATEEFKDLDTLMNLLQVDLIIAMLTHETLSGLADLLIIKTIDTAEQMVYPHGGFSIAIEIEYHCSLTTM